MYVDNFYHELDKKTKVLKSIKKGLIVMFNLRTKVDVENLTDYDMLVLLRFVSSDFKDVKVEDIVITQSTDGYIVSSELGDIEFIFDVYAKCLTVREEHRDLDLNLDSILLDISKKRYDRNDYTLSDFLKSFDIVRLFNSLLDYFNWQLETELAVYDTLIDSVLQEATDEAIEELRQKIDVYNVLSNLSTIEDIYSMLNNNEYYFNMFAKDIMTNFKKHIVR